MLLVTGGAGFIGSNFIRNWLQVTTEPVINVDKLTYAGSLQNLAYALQNPQHFFVRADICDVHVISELLAKNVPRAVINLAAETHVDRSINDPDQFVRTNVLGTLQLLKASCAYWSTLPPEQRNPFRFLHISTDEVYGSLAVGAPPFSETAPYAPNSPYAASKASSDHLVRAFHSTHGLPTLTINCSNNYGPYQFPEKLIPLAIHNALTDQEIPIYGDGQNIRDWLHVSDHCAAIQSVLTYGRPGETYNIGAANERANVEVVQLICNFLDEERPRPDSRSYKRQIRFVKDRPGHDRRYAIDGSKARKELRWAPKKAFLGGLRRTVCWYLDNQEWVKNVTNAAYRDWVPIQHRQPA
jgi:dTDP-glucose 4,6-dehydratase